MGWSLGDWQQASVYVSFHFKLENHSCATALSHSPIPSTAAQAGDSATRVLATIGVFLGGEGIEVGMLTPFSTSPHASEGHGPFPDDTESLIPWEIPAALQSLVLLPSLCLEQPSAWQAPQSSYLCTPHHQLLPWMQVQLMHLQQHPWRPHGNFLSLPHGETWKGHHFTGLLSSHLQNKTHEVCTEAYRVLYLKSFTDKNV